MPGVTRLLENCVPSHYDLRITLDDSGTSFTGRVVITATVPQRSSNITLHTKGLQITSTKINKQFAAKNFHDDELTLHVPDAVHGEVTITLEYTGKITDSLHGFYPGRYQHDGETKQLFLTQFESHHAREAFPCIDEPAAKATFDLTITAAKNLTVLANTPVKSRKTSGDTQTVRFETSPRMSTYLLAWVIGDLHALEARSAGGTDVKVWATKATPLAELEFARDTAIKTLDFYNDYFGVPYPLPKLDHVAIPDFSAGAMENWGLITYREIALLVNETTPVDAKQYVALVIAHETAHQWFGNLVTMQWWDDLWLNESFANMMEYVATDAIFPEMNIWKTFITREAAAALRRDAIPGVQSVQTPINHPDEISSIFDPAIVYAKGGRLLNMIRAHIGEKAFRSGLKIYFKQHKYANTTGDDLWRALTKSSKTDVAELITPWLTRPHYPVLSVNRDGTTTSLRQDAFALGEHDESYLWPLPLDASNKKSPQVLQERSTSFTSRTPVWFNSHSTTHSLTYYDHDLRQQILRDTLAGKRDEISRITYLMDAALLAKGGRLATSEHFATLAAYKNESSDQVWLLMSSLIAQLKPFVEPDSNHEKSLRRLAHDLAVPHFAKLGLLPREGDTPADIRRRGTLTDLMLFGRDQPVIDQLLALYRQGKVADQPGDTREAIYTAVSLFGDDSERDELLAAYPTASPNGVVELTRALASARTSEFITQLIEKLLDAQFIRLHDLPRWFAFLISNRHAREQTWQWLTHNWAEIVTRFAGDKHYDDFVRYSASAITTPELAAAYREFFADKTSDPALARAIEMGQKEIAQRLEWIARDKPGVLRELENYAQSKDS